jgi:DNA mismatch repair protein MSH4
MVKPEFTGTLAISKGKHPILALTPATTRGESVVPNDAYASDDTSFVIITGPNMVGSEDQ